MKKTVKSNKGNLEKIKTEGIRKIDDKEWDIKVEIKDDRKTKDEVFEMIVEFFKKHGMWIGESIIQSDCAYVDGPDLLVEIVEKIVEKVDHGD